MNYKTITRPECTVAGLSARTNNTAPDMTTVIGTLWNTFYQKGVYESLPGKISQHALGIYTQYDGNQTDDYTAVVATEIAPQTAAAVANGTTTLPDGCSLFTIPAGTYAVFSTQTSMAESYAAIAQLWQEIWSLNLNRTFVADFEEYSAPDSDGTETVSIYIGIKS